jgi:hypothetical protein
MQISEALLARIAQLEQERDKAIAAANVASGRVQECRFWLEQIQKEIKHEGSP